MGSFPHLGRSLFSEGLEKMDGKESLLSGFGKNPEDDWWGASERAAFEFLVSTGFLERGRPLCMCRSQYFWSGAASLEHRHFFPSVLLHLPGSGSEPLDKRILKETHLPTNQINKNNKTHQIFPLKSLVHNRDFIIHSRYFIRRWKRNKK